MKKNILFKRLLAANYHGFYLSQINDYIRIDFNKNASYLSNEIYEKMLKNYKIVNDVKIQDGVIQALDKIDEILEALKLPSLEKWYNKWINEKYDIKGEDRK